MKFSLFASRAASQPCHLALAIASLFAIPAPALAIDVESGSADTVIRWDNTIRYQLARRSGSPDPAILASPNNDDGDRNFNKGIVSDRIDLLSEFDAVYQQYSGLRLSGAAWYDPAYQGALGNSSAPTSNHLSNGVRALGLSPYTRRNYRGTSGEVLDAFAFTRVELGSVPINIKAGRHTVYWGESLLLGGSIHGINYAQSPLDLAKGFAIPGVEAKELFRPLSNFSFQAQLTDELSIAGQYFMEWEPIRAPEAGSYLGFNDALLGGGESLIVGPGQILLRGTDTLPKQRGDWGFSSRWNPKWLDGTVGAYYRKFTDKVPQVLGAPAAAALPAALCTGLGFRPIAPTTCYVNPGVATVPQLLAGQVGQYSFSYGGNIELYGLSLSKNVGGASIGAELSYRRNMPLLSVAVTVLPQPLATMQASTGAIANLPQQGHVGGAVGDTMHAVVNAIGTLSTTILFDSATWQAELTWSEWTKVTQNKAAFKGADSYSFIDHVTKQATQLGINFTPAWYQVFPGVDLTAPISYSVGLSGNAAVAFGGNKGAGLFSYGIGADVRQKYRLDLRYVGFFGANQTNAAGQIIASAGNAPLLKDRGMVVLTFKTTF